MKQNITLKIKSNKLKNEYLLSCQIERVIIYIEKRRNIKIKSFAFGTINDDFLKNRFRLKLSY